MTRELLGFGLAGVLIAAAVVGTWVACNAYIPVKPRRWVRWVYSGLVLLLGGPLILLFVGSNVSEGDMLCLECGRSRHELTVFSVGIPVERDMKAPGVGATSGEYAALLPETLDATHSHSWTIVGCHESGIGFGGTISCTKIGACHWYRDLPKLSDRALAAALAERFARASPNERSDALRSYDDVAYTTAPVDDRVSAWRTGWALQHSPWP